MSTTIHTVSFIGSGNVATHMARRLHASGITIQEVWSYHLKNAEELARSVHAEVCSTLQELKPVDLVIISIKDDAIPEVLMQLPASVSAVVHTSGGVDLAALGNFPATGVLYALQTFNKNENMDWNEVPVCIEASDPGFLEVLQAFAARLSENITILSSADRNTLHIAAVMVNNFTNYLYASAYEYLQTSQIPFRLLLPLIRHTANRLHGTDPFLLQTGPAVRKDTSLMNKHLDMLGSHENLQELYRYFSEKIIKKTGN